jgi:molybdopterin-containing oxidoreductase family membrane subunit
MSSAANIAVGVAPGNKSWSGWLIVFGVLFMAALGGLAMVLKSDPTRISWPFFAANYVFLLGLSQFGIAYTAIMRICGGNFSRPYYRLGEVITLAFMPLAIIGLVLIVKYGAEDLFHWLHPAEGSHQSPWLNLEGLFWRNMMAMLAVYALALVYFFYGLLPDIKDSDARSGSALRRGMYKMLLSVKSGKNMEDIQRRLYFWSPVVLVFVAVSQTFTSWDFGMMLSEHYHSTVFSMYYIIGSMFGGSAAILFLGILMARMTGATGFFRETQVKSMGILLTAFAILWLYFFWEQFFVTWFGNLDYETGPLWKKMYGHYSVYFWTQVVCIIGIPIGSLIFARVKRTWWMMTILTLIMLAGVWLNRFLIVVSPVSDNYQPFTELGDIAITLGLLSGFMFFLYWMFNQFPMVSAWEVDGTEDSGH